MVDSWPRKNPARPATVLVKPFPIILIGPRGAGKSSVAPLLAATLRCRWVDLDAEIVSMTGGQSILEIFQSDGAEHFRDLETQALERALVRCEADSTAPRVLASGGGIVQREANRVAMRDRAHVIYLQACAETLVRRLPTPDRGRPRLRSNVSWVEEIESVVAEREPLYLEAAHTVIRTDPLNDDGQHAYRTPEEVAAQIAALVPTSR